VLLVMPADHVIADLAGFQAAIDAGIPAALEGAIVTFGIVPDRAETGYGYIRCGADRADGSKAIAAFVENPTPPPPSVTSTAANTSGTAASSWSGRAPG
jgi:mannose-1-phosphate guanylyltransferase/mannose-6-phosphate isomerase